MGKYIPNTVVIYLSVIRLKITLGAFRVVFLYGMEMELESDKYYKMKKVLFILSVFFTLSASAQNYDWALGLRLGGNAGFTMKKSLGRSTAFEGILSPSDRGLLAVALLEKHHAFLNEPGLSWYYGAGGHAGFWNEGGPNHYFRYSEGHYALGVDGILGLEYSFVSVPLNFSIDWKPAFNLAEYTGFYYGDAALSIRIKI